MKLTEAARHDLHELEKALASGTEAEDAHTLFIRARFGFQQALVSWPDTLEARAGRDAAILAMARAEIRAGRLETAERLVSELQSPPDDVLEALAALQSAAAAKDRELDTLREFRDQYDVHASSDSRKLILRTVGVVYTVAALGVASIERMGLFVASNEHLLISALAFLLFLLVTGWLGREQLMSTRVNSAGYLIFVSVAVLIVLVRIAFLARRIPLAAGLPVDLVLYAMAAAAEAAVLDRRMWIGALVFVLGAAVAFFWPQWALFTVGATIGVAIGVMDLVLHGPGSGSPSD